MIRPPGFLSRCLVLVFAVLPASCGDAADEACVRDARNAGYPTKISDINIGWSLSGTRTDGYQCTKDPQTVLGGEPCWHLRNVEPVSEVLGSPSEGQYDWASWSQRLFVSERNVAGHWLRLEAWVKTREAVSGAFIRLTADDSADPGGFLPVTGTTADFVKRTDMIRVPARAQTLVPHLFLLGSGEAWFGSVTLIDAGPCNVPVL